MKLFSNEGWRIYLKDCNIGKALTNKNFNKECMVNFDWVVDVHRACPSRTHQTFSAIFVVVKTSNSVAHKSPVFFFFQVFFLLALQVLLTSLYMIKEVSKTYNDFK